METKKFITDFKEKMNKAKDWAEVKEIMNQALDYVNEHIEKFTESQIKIMQSYFENHPLKEESTTKKIIPLSRINIVLKSSS